MSNRLRISLAAFAILILANIAWRVWAGWGLITIDADNAPLAGVIRSLEKQGGIRLVTNAASDQTVTMHVRNVTLNRALKVLSINSGGSATAAYLTAPDKNSINSLLADWSGGADTEGWKRFTLPMMGGPGMGGFGNAGDPREERWTVEAASEPKLQAYLEQGSLKIAAEFWVPAEWNPEVASAPSTGQVGDVVRKLAKSAGGQSEQIFLLNLPSQRPQTADAPAGAPPRGPDGGFAQGRPPSGRLQGGPPGPPDERTRAAMEAREVARIEKLPAEEKAAALAELDERKKFFESLAGLTEEERREKIKERIENSMRGAPTKRDDRFTQMDAMRTAEQRANFFRMVLKHKSEATGR